MIRRIPSFPALAAILALAAGAAPAAATGADRTGFGDWRAMCEPSGPCRAETTGSTGGQADDMVRLTVQRAGDTASGWTIALHFPHAVPDPKHALALVIDGAHRFAARPQGALRRFGAPGHLHVADDRLAAGLLPALLEGAQARLDYIDITGEARTVDISLSGLTASLLWMEERLGIVGAERRGIAAAGPAPAGARSEIETIRAAGIPEPVLVRHADTSECEDLGSEHMSRFAPVIELASATAILYALPCTAGAYNVAYRLYIRERGEIGGVRTLYFATFSQSHGWSGTDILFNITADGPHLSAFYKGRGIGDCGTWGRWTFADYAFRLEEFAAMDTCNGVTSENWPVVYRAR